MDDASSQPGTLFDIQAEQCVIGAMMLNPDAYATVREIVRPEDFSQKSHKDIFRAAASICGSGGHPDAITLTTELRAKKLLAGAGDVDYLLEIFRTTPGASNAAAYARVVRDFAQRRTLIAVLGETQDKAAKGIQTTDELLSFVSTQVSQIAGRNIGASVAWPQTMEAGIDAIARAEERRAAGGSVGVSTSLPALDDFTGGLYGSTLWCIAGRPGDGKSALALQIMISAAVRGMPCGMMAIELSDEQIAHRAMAHRLQLPLQGLSRGDPQTVGRLGVQQARFPMNDLPIWTDYQTDTLDGVISRLTEWKRKYAIQFAVVDHIGLIEPPDNRMSRNDWLGRVSRSLKKTCKALEMPILALSQLNRTNKKEGRRPALQDLRDSGNIEQDVDIALFIHCPEEGEQDRQLGFLKNRAGPIGWLSEQFVFDGSLQTYREIIREAYV